MIILFFVILSKYKAESFHDFRNFYFLFFLFCKTKSGIVFIIYLRLNLPTPLPLGVWFIYLIITCSLTCHKLKYFCTVYFDRFGCNQPHAHYQCLNRVKQLIQYNGFIHTEVDWAWSIRWYGTIRCQYSTILSSRLISTYR